MNISKQGGVSWEDVTEFERSYRVDFPSDYEEFLVKYNGGPTPKTEFRVGRIDSDVRCFFGIGDVENSVHSLDLPEWLEQGVFPIAEDSFGNYIVMDIKKAPGTVYFADHEEGFRLSRLTESFSAFLAKCKSRKVHMERATRSIAEREASMIAKGNGALITDGLRKCWQDEIDRYTGLVLEKVVLS